MLVYFVNSVIILYFAGIIYFLTLRYENEEGISTIVISPIQPFAMASEWIVQMKKQKPGMALAINILE
jgi:hypothetical protein